jgi:hypothetical protein
MVVCDELFKGKKKSVGGIRRWLRESIVLDIRTDGIPHAKTVVNMCVRARGDGVVERLEKQLGGYALSIRPQLV